jgi:adenosylcobinamide-GDP ribazoletransferase
VRSFLIALQFLTSIPFKMKNIKAAELPGSVTYYPAVGAIIGAVLASSCLFFSVFFSQSISPLLTLGVYILITGALHLDGFADTVDGLYGGSTKKDILRIMADSATGAKSVVWVVFIIALKAIILITLPSNRLYPAFLLFPVLGRYSIALLMKYSFYAKEQGLGKVYCKNITGVQFLILNVFTVLLLMLFGSLGLVAFIAVVLVAFIIKKYFENKLGGVTGDVFGFSVEVTEAVALLIFTIK